MRIKFFALLAILFFLIGCAFTSGQVPLNYYPSVNSQYQYLSSKNLKVGEIIDERGKAPDFLLNKVNGYGQKTSGAYLAERPVADIIKDALKSSFDQLGVVNDPTGQKVLNGRLLGLDFDVVSSFFTSTLYVKVSMEFSLQDITTGSVIWKEVIIGNGENRSGNMFADKYIVPGFKEAMDHLIDNLLKSETFKDALK